MRKFVEVVVQQARANLTLFITYLLDIIISEHQEGNQLLM